MIGASREELLAQWEGILLAIEDRDGFVEAVMAVFDRRPWDMGMRAVAVRVAGKRGPALVACVREAWPEVEDKGPPKKISPPLQPAEESKTQAQPEGVAAAEPEFDAEAFAREGKERLNRQAATEMAAKAKPSVEEPKGSATPSAGAEILGRLDVAERVRKAETARAQAEAKKPAQPLPDVEPPPDVTELDRLTYPRGLLGDVVQYVVDTDAFPNRWLSLAVAVSAMAKACDRKVIGPTNNSTILFTLVIGESGAGKQHGLNCIRVLLKALGLGDVIIGSGIASQQSIEEILEGNGSGQAFGACNHRRDWEFPDEDILERPDRKRLRNPASAHELVGLAAGIGMAGEHQGREDRDYGLRSGIRDHRLHHRAIAVPGVDDEGDRQRLR
jgi:hypothetical protein